MLQIHGVSSIPAAKSHFGVLDGLRGTAACCVFLVHSFNRELAPNGFLGVDLFFMLSGFVVAYAYRRRLVGGMTLREFALRRIIRLWPMVLVGVLFGAATAVLHNLSKPLDAYAPQDIALATGLGAFVIPWVSPNAIMDAVFPLNPVLWSLFFELVANTVYALVPRLMGSKTVLLLIASLGLIITVLAGDLGGGAPATFLLGFARVGFGFFAGALIYELWADGNISKASIGLWPSSAALVTITFIPYEVHGAWFLPVAAVFAAMIAFGANAEPQRNTSAICRVLGDISYPMYLIHWPVLYVVVGILKRFAEPQGYAYAVMVIIAFVATIVSSWLAVVLYDLPVRKMLSQRLLPNPQLQ